MGSLQGTLSHAQHRVWSVRSAEYNGRLVDDDQYGDRSDMLRPVRRPLDDSHTIIGCLAAPLQRQGAYTRVHTGRKSVAPGIQRPTSMPCRCLLIEQTITQSFSLMADSEFD